MRRVLAVIGVGAALALGACGGDDEEQAPAGGAAETPAATEENGGTTAAADGKELFGRACAGCHTLADAGADGQVGPNLDEVKPDAAQVRDAIESGPGAMPENLYQGEEADAVAEYVAQASGGS